MAVIHVQKFRRGAVGGLQIHDKREKDGVSHTNPDIDWSKTNQNYDLHNPYGWKRSYHADITARINELNLGKAIRKDAVVMCGILVSSDHLYFEGKNSHEIEEFFRESYQFLCARYGEENVISSTVHMDEKTPHMHFYFVPVTDERLSAKRLITRKELTALHTDFYTTIGKRYGLDRGQEGNARQHIETARYKKEQAEREAHIAAQKAAEATERRKQAEQQLHAVEKQLDAHKATISTYAEIDSMGKSRLGGGRVLTKDEYEKLTEQAKAYYEANSCRYDYERKVRNLNDRLRVANSRVAPLSERVGELERENKSLKKELKQIASVIDSSPSLAKAYELAEKALSELLRTTRKERNRDTFSR